MSTAINSFFSGKSILITGASSGLGWALAEALAPCRVKLGLLGRNTEKLQELAAKLRYTGSEFIVLTCDVQDRHAVEQSVQEFHQLAGGLDMVWVNSGISRSTFFPNWDWQNVEAIINTNIMGAMYTTKACADIMVQQDSGTIVAIGCLARKAGSFHQARHLQHDQNRTESLHRKSGCRAATTAFYPDPPRICRYSHQSR